MDCIRYNIFIFLIIIYGNYSLETTLLSYVINNNRSYTCVIKPDIKNSALTFITPLGRAYNYRLDSIYKSINGVQIQSDPYDCDFEPEVTCINTWNKPYTTLVAATAKNELHDLHPVLDERWETDKTVQHTFKQELHNVGISARTGGDVNIILCDDKTSSHKCYWFTIQKKKSSLSICEITTLENIYQDESSCNVLHTGSEITVKEILWTHFKISAYDNFANITFEDEKGLKLLNGTLSESISVTRVLFTSNKKALWRVHDYNYLSITWNSGGGWLNVGPELKVNETSSLCVALYAVTCTTCTLSLRLGSTSNEIKVEGNRKMDRQEWQYIRLFIKSARKNFGYNIQVKISGDARGFWLIDDVRRCYEQESRVLNLSASMNDNDTVSCQSLDNSKQWSSIKGGQIQQSNLIVCDNATFTGSKCDVSCKSVLGTDSCRKLIVCEPSSNRNMPSCNCAAGYRGSRCEEICPQGYYGSECKKVCKPCKGFCLNSSGLCPVGKKCTLNDTDPGCTRVMNAPRNVTVIWNENVMEINWLHPALFSKNKQVTSFSILIKQVETILKEQELHNYNKSYSLNVTQDKYIFMVSDNLPLSSTYEIQVHAVADSDTLENNIATVMILSPPVTPEFIGNVTWNTQKDSNLNIIIPAVDKSTITDQSSMYIFLCSPGGKKPNLKNGNMLHYKLHNWTKCQGTSSIPKKIEIPEKIINYSISDNKDWFENGQLSPDSIYIIHVVFINEYKRMFKHTITSVSTEELHSSNPALYALLVLLFIPVIAWFIYWKLKQTPNKILEPTVHYQAVSTNQMVTINNQPSKTINNFSQSNLTTSISNRHSKLPTPPNDDNNIKNNTFSKPVKIKHFSDYVKESLKYNELERQFKLLPLGGNKPWLTGLSEQNIHKNRYKNLTAYDHSRVILQKTEGDAYSDFINANYIDGYNQKKAYIATQGPKNSTLNDFWRMIWQEKVKCIVMVTNLIEEGKKKCDKYWPEIGETEIYGFITVTFKRVDTYADFQSRFFTIKNNNATREVQQLHFSSWPDHGIPMYPQSLVPFLRAVLKVSVSEAPIVVHCSAGVGRTGTIILCDICSRMASHEKQIDVLKYLHSIREQRVNMVASYDQYELVHMILIENLISLNTSYGCIGLSKTVEELVKSGELKKQMQFIQNVAWQNMHSSSTEDNIQNNSKNRFTHIVPKYRRIYLSKISYADESSDYINAVPVDGYKNKGQFIVTQNPLPNTITDFWRMVIEFNVQVIVSLNDFPKNQSSAIYWPTKKNEVITFSNFILTCQLVQDELNYKTYKIKLQDKNFMENEVNIFIMHIENWKYEQLTPSSEKQIVTLIESVPKLPGMNSPIVISCYDGARASGIFVALSFIIEKIKFEQVCDVCLAVRSVRTNREQFISSIEQLEFLYKAAVYFVSTFESYSNFSQVQNIV